MTIKGKIATAISMIIANKIIKRIFENKKGNKKRSV
jgi:hypothetical protein